MIYNSVKYILSGVFLLSALSKMLDYNATVDLFSTLLGIGTILSKTLLAALILIEILIAYLVIADQIKKDSVFAIVATMVFIFLIVNIIFIVNGEANCGCFGTQIMSTPVRSIIKNILLLFGFGYLKFFNESIKINFFSKVIK